MSEEKPIQEPRIAFCSRSQQKVILGLVIIFSLGVASGLISNAFNEKGIPVLPQILWSGAVGEIKRMDINDGDAVKFNGFVIDARPSPLYEECHVQEALNFPPGNFDFFYGLHFSDLSKEFKDLPIFIYGRSLSRAYDQQLGHKLLQKGHSNITIVRLQHHCPPPMKQRPLSNQEQYRTQRFTRAFETIYSKIPTGITELTSLASSNKRRNDNLG